MIVKKLLSCFLFLLLCTFLRADYVKWVWVSWTDNGVAKTNLFYPGSSQTIYRDPGTVTDLRVYKIDTGAPTTVDFIFHDINNNKSLIYSSSNLYYAFNNEVGPLETQIWAGINNYTDIVEIFVRNNATLYPDLVVSNITVNSSTTPRTYYVGESVSVSCNVWNLGQGAAGSSYLGYYFGTSSSDTSYRWGSDSVSALSSNTGSNESSTYTFQSSDIGTRYFVFKADYQGQVDEGTNEGNNVSSFGPFTVQAAVGSFKGYIEPSEARTAGAQWRLTSGPDTSWKNSGTTISNIPIGNYTITFSTISGWTKPGDQSVSVTTNNTTSYTGTYQSVVYSLTVNVSNVLGGDPSVPAGFGRVYLYDTSWSQVTGITNPVNTINGAASFNNVPAGSYNYRVYVESPSGLGTEFWGEGSIVLDQTKTVPFARNWPFIENIIIENAATNETLYWGSTVPVGTSLRFKMRVKNPNTVNVSAKVQAILDRNRDQNNDFSSTSGSSTVSSNGTYTWDITLGPLTIASDYYFGGLCYSLYNTDPNVITDTNGYLHSDEQVIHISSTTTTRINSGTFPDRAGNRGMPVLLEAKLEEDTSTGLPIPNKQLIFSIHYDGAWHDIPEDDISNTSSVTNHEGNANVIFFIPKELAIGAYQIKARFDGDASYSACEKVSSLIVHEALWTIAIYLDADNDLEAAGCHDYYDEIRGAANNPYVNIIVLFDRALKNTGEGYVGDYNDIPTWDKTRKYIVVPDFDLFYELQDEQNMGDPNVLLNFLESTFLEFPSQYTAAVLWDHGDGWIPDSGVFFNVNSSSSQKKTFKIVSNTNIDEVFSRKKLFKDYGSGSSNDFLLEKSVCFDESHSDALNLDEISDALDVLPYKIDVFGFDACLMGMVEVAFQLLPYVHVFIGSETSELADGWEYQKWIGQDINSLTTPAKLAQSIVNEYQVRYSGSDYPASLSAWNLDDFGGLISSINLLAESLNEKLHEIPFQLRKDIRDFSECVSQDYDSVNFSDYLSYYDAGTIAYQINQLVSDQPIKGLAQNLIAELNSSRRIAFWFNASSFNNIAGMAGISLYSFDLSYNYDYSDSDTLQFANEFWDDLQKVYWGGHLRVNISPQGAIDDGAMWRITSSQDWHLSGEIINLPIGDYAVTFKNIANWTSPGNINTTIVNCLLNELSGTYSPIVQNGSLNVSVFPQQAIAAGAQWKLTVETVWHNSGDTINLAPGSYVVRFKTLEGWIMPANVDVTINPGQLTQISGTYTGIPIINKMPDLLSPVCAAGNNAPGEKIYLYNGGNGILNYTISDGGCAWLECSPASGSSTGETDMVNVTYSTSGLPAGSYNATITISDPNAANTPQTIQVNLTVNPVKTLSSIAIEGPNQVNENATQDYNCRAYYSDNTNALVEPSWGENSAYASINGSGLLTTTEVPFDQGCLVTASYTEGGLTKNANLSVMIMDVPPETPSISSLVPDQGEAGTPVTLNGSNFGATQGTVTFNGTSAAITSWNDTQIQTAVPAGAATGAVVARTSDGVDSNGVTFTVTTQTAPEIKIKYGETALPSGGFYNFGTHQVGASADVTFTIQNTGNADLILSGTPKVSLSGTNADQFEVIQQPDSPVVPLGSTTFIVRFAPTSEGDKNANLSIANNDSDEDPYVINLRGSGSEGKTYIFGFNEGTGSTFADTNANGISGTVYNGAQWVASGIRDNGGSTGYAIQYDGTNDYARLDSHPLTDGPFTIMLWAKKLGQGTGNSVQLVRANEPGTAGAYCLYWYNVNSIQSLVCTASGNTWLAYNDPLLDQWLHVAFSYDQSATKLYINGELIQEAQQSGALNSPNWPFSIGGQGGGMDDSYFNGCIDGLKVMQSAMTIDQIRQIYNAEKPESTPSVSCDDFEDGDLVGWTYSEGVSASTENSKNGSYSARLYDGSSSDGANMQYVLNTSSSRIAIEFWEWTNSITAGTGYLLSDTEGWGSGWGFLFGANVNTQNYWRYSSNTNKADWVSSNPWTTWDVDFPVQVAGTNSTWHRIRVEIYGPEGKVRFWYDGEYKGEVTVDTVTQPLKYFHHDISWSSPTGIVNYLDDICFYELAAPAPAIESLVPDQGTVGTPVTVNGSNFGTAQGTVTFNGALAAITSWSATQIQTVVPAGAATGPVVVTTSGGQGSNGVNFTVLGAGAPEIDVKQGTSSIASGGDFNFGTILVGAGSEITFLVENSGNADLVLDGTPKVTLSGAGADQFSVTQQPDSPVVPSGSTTFIVRFAPTSVGTKSALLGIANNDSDENPYVINLSGTGSVSDSLIKIVYGSESGVSLLTLNQDYSVQSKTLLAGSPAGDPIWSRDGQKIAYGASGHEIWTMNADGSNQVKAVTSSLYCGPVEWGIDPDILFIGNSYAGDGEAAQLRISTGEITQLTNVAGQNTQSYDLNSEQTKVAYVRGTEGNGWSNVLYYANFAFESSDFINKNLLPDALPSPHEPRLSPSGTRIIFLACTSASTGLGLINTDGTGFSTPVPLVSGEYVYYVDWIDENRIVYLLSKSSGRQMHVLDLHDMSMTPITDTADANGKLQVYVVSAPAATLSVLVPNGGDMWTAGENRNITWSSSGSLSSVNIDYSIDNGTSWIPVVAGTANDGTHPWIVPDTPSVNCLVRVSDSDGNPSDASDNVFIIQSGVIAPVISGTILFNSSPLAGVVMNGLPGNPATAASGYYSSSVDFDWSGTVTPTLAGYVFTPASRNYSNVTSDQAGQDYAAALTPALELTSPNGWEHWTLGCTKAITWNAINYTGTVRLVLFKNGVRFGNIVANIPASAGSYAWTVGQTYDSGMAPEGSDYRLYLRSTDNTIVEPSDYRLGLIEPAQLELTAPNGGESWELGTTQNITWNANGYVGTVRLTLYNKAAKIGQIAGSLPADQGSYLWTVGANANGTAAAGINYSIRLQAGDSSQDDFSDGPLTLIENDALVVDHHHTAMNVIPSGWLEQAKQHRLLVLSAQGDDPVTLGLRLLGSKDARLAPVASPNELGLVVREESWLPQGVALDPQEWCWSLEKAILDSQATVAVVRPDEGALLAGRLNAESYLQVMSGLAERLPQVRLVCSTIGMDEANELLAKFNRQVRESVLRNQGILLDAADIESWRNGEQYMVNEAPVSHPSYRLQGLASEENLGRQGAAAWWLLARLAGWEDPKTELSE